MKTALCIVFLHMADGSLDAIRNVQCERAKYLAETQEMRRFGVKDTYYMEQSPRDDWRDAGATRAKEET